MNKGAGLWTIIKVEHLRELWAEGLTAREIAEDLGRGFTRGSVIGKAWRLKLTARPSPLCPPKKRVPVPPPPRPKPPPPAPRVLTLSQQPQQPQQPRMRRLQLIDLEDKHCRWIIGDPHYGSYYFCAADAVEGGVYCPFHHRMAFAKQREA